MIRAIRHLIRKLFVRHTWVYQDGAEVQRTCTVCGAEQIEIRDNWGPCWGTLVDGDVELHWSEK